MKRNFLAVVGLASMLALPSIAQAQGVPGGAAEGAAAGGAAAGLPGAIVGGVVGGVAGGVAGVLGVDQRPRFREYVVQQHRPSYQYRNEVRVGVRLPAEGVRYYEVPAEYGAEATATRS